MMLKIILVLSLSLALSSAQLLQNGQCDPNIQLQSDFRVADFMQRWYVVRRSGSSISTSDCSYIELSQSNDTLSIYNWSVNDNFLEETTANVNLENGTAKFNFELPSSNQSLDFWIITTDYENLALAYSCVNFNTTHRHLLLWQLGRTTSFPTNMMEALLNNTLVSLFNLTSNDLVPVDHSAMACAILPEIPAGQPIILPGQCNPNISVVENFNVSAFTGLWHQIATYYSTNGQGTCNRAEYTLSGDVVQVLNSQIVNLALDSVAGNATVVSNDGSARLSVVLEVSPGVIVESPLWILATDYTSYAVAYICSDLQNNQRRVNTWIASRSRQLSADAQKSVNEVIGSYLDLNDRYLIRSNQTNEGCFFYPPVVPNQPVTFRGQCEENINVVQNFNVTAYLGLWHNIESYPSLFTPGTCNNAQYSLEDGVVDVFNTQVIDQRLDTVNGVAVVASTDGSAKLTVSFPIAGTNLTTSTKYWVLDTDYNNYALVYSCINVTEDERTVYSWKLSRSKSLQNASITAINRVVASVPVLDQRYYEVNNQSPEGCFYYPEPQRGVPVRFPGQCEDIPVVREFNLTQFQGTWHEVQAYPKEQQPGQCVSHEFSLNANNGYNLRTTGVDDQFAVVSNSVVSLTTTDGSAKMTISITANGQTIQIPYWILNTDYGNYALAYSCVNEGPDFRMVYSWKLSRTPQLSPASLTAINNTIQSINVLDEKYYERVDQSEVACFTLPVIAPGNPIILDGQCDPNVPVIQNFNLTNYAGRWRIIESYADSQLSGTCNDVSYSQINGSISVYNSLVNNQELVTVTGSASLASNDGSGRLHVSVPTAANPIEYWILATDYVSYSLVYNCVNIGSTQKRIVSWKLSRSSSLSSEANNAMDQIIRSVQVLNNRYYQPLDQSDNGCFYYPPPSSNTPIIFRGQCDPNINVVQNFNVAGYLGQWYDISSYPTRFQQGTCGNALYSLNGDVVDVFNTEVIDQSLSTINGVARLATTDGSAKLTVSFPIAGTNLTTSTSYWVLATDYDSYALVYSCFNIDAETRQVSSWKLSRSKELSVNATQAINTVVNSIPVLDDRYYNTQDQSSEGCFYFPEAQQGVPVVFPGQCDSSIQAVPNFNMSAFTGIWHEIQAYPKDQQNGQCINHQFYSTSSNNMALVSSNVINQILGQSSSNVVFASPQDLSGKLNISFTSGGTNITIPYWILSTDYSSYALAYSCVNLNASFRGVYSWKLSRTKELNIYNSLAINNAIERINVLDNKYYENIDQSDDACFFLPDPVPNQPVVFVGQCDENIEVVQNFNASRYLGRWRLIESYPQVNQRGSCSQATYSLNANGTVDVFNTEVVNQELSTIDGLAVLASNDGSAKLLVTFPETTEPAPYWVLDTDYDSYSLVYSCRNLANNQRLVTSWKLSRTSALTPNATQNINQVVNSINVLNQRFYASVAQTDQACFYFPTHDPDTPVVFRGQCDQNIPVVSNFNVSAYLGQWYDTSSYPSRFQQGTCGNAYYSLSGSVVDVFNTEVVNQTLSTINGVARLATADGSAKLIVSFPIAGTNLTTETPYWVLATDYSSYALVYSCVNIDLEHRRVTSWKLSRSKQLASSSLASINNVVNTIQVLDDRYFDNRDQSDEGCFYLPEAQPGVPVVFPGQCDQSIQAVSNFSMSAFQGVWHEISAYPKDQQSGQCINHDYSLITPNALDLVSSNVIDQLQNIYSSRVTFASPQDSSGKLSITLNSAGSNIVIPFWVLSTDYTDYALAYSCVNRDESSRAVYSWKLSRSKQLSSAGNNVINNKISEINVLDNKYYENIDQSDAACFYLPVVSPGQPVLFPGQCDPNIPVVQNFDAVAYAGRWRMIETYASDFQDARATCSDATYTLTGNVVDVVNTQVINQALDVINGNATLATTDGSAKLFVNFPNSPGPSDYWVLSTDYDSYALVYSCRNVSSTQRRVYTWKLSRTRDLSINATTEINRVINSINVLNQQYYSRIEHTDSACFYYPVADGSPVTFRGQCDENIPVVTNFNAVAYMNTWYDIESYPVRFQDGTCPSATYTLGSAVDVYNTQVVRQQLDTINGVAVFAGDSNVAKLTVSFPIAGTNLTTSSPYWVLSTDYVNFALVYSCSNVDEENYRIGSWKLSRQKSLSPASITAINNVMNSIPVLRQDYYLERGHSDEDCFYYPDNNGGPVIQDGQCEFDSLSVVNDFDASAFSGPWYEIARYPSELQEGECVSSQFEVNNQQIVMSKNIVFNERQLTLVGPATPAGNGRGILNVNLTGDGVNFATTFYVLDVDYNDFALLYSCNNINNASKQVYSWKLSRSQQGLSQNAQNRIVDVVNRTRELFQGYYEETDQNASGCFHYPEYTELPSQIELIGRCDDSIRAKANFSVQDYLGKWYEIASYPQPFQTGECARAHYSAADASGRVAVLNTQVLDRALDLQHATAVVASNDGSGLLEVTFVLENGVTNVVNYYVLETDYTSYSLVYSCRNLPSGNRIVSSWKLSRDTTLSPSAVPIIDSIISNTQGLNEGFYRQTNQSSEACFYIPEIDKNETPQFRGQCADVQGVEGFDTQRFLGWWHEIESYPSYENRGTCISSEYSQDGNTFQVVDTNVFGLSAQINSSEVVISNNGRLRRNVNGQNIDLWVLATDYDNYALLYSCENIDANYRRVWSGKYSKSRVLSENAQNAIATVIEREETLEPQLFLSVNQSDDACFYYPEATGDPVVLPGNCDPNIPVVTNFSVVDYSGVWYQIEKYPQIHENGSCVGARYTYDENANVVEVLNWQVIDGVLDSVAGNATLNSDDGSAKLLVNLPIRFTDDAEPQMVSMELYILATDYLSYSLAYSCVNVGPYRRSVGVWKLSRTRSLLPEGVSVINSLIQSRQELNQDYFLSVEQNNDCDEPSSSILVKSSIIVLIICSILHLL